MPLTITLNGHPREFPALEAGASLTELVAEMGLKPDRVAVERNGDIVSRRSWGDVRMSAGDKLEVVHFVGGGNARGRFQPINKPFARRCARSRLHV